MRLYALRDFARAHAHHAALRRADPPYLRRERRDAPLRARIYLALQSRHGLRAALARAQRLYHRAGLFHNEHAHRDDRRGTQHCARPAFHVRVRHGRARRGGRDGPFAGRLVRVGRALPLLKAIDAAAAREESAAGYEAPSPLSRARALAVPHADHGKSRCGELQRDAPPLRRRHRRRRGDGPHDHDESFHAAPARSHAGRAAHYELQLRRGQRAARARDVPHSVYQLSFRLHARVGGVHAVSRRRGRDLHAGRRAWRLHRVGHAHLYGRERHFRHPDRVPAELCGAWPGKGRDLPRAAAQGDPAHPAHFPSAAARYF